MAPCPQRGDWIPGGGRAGRGLPAGGRVATGLYPALLPGRARATSAGGHVVCWDGRGQPSSSCPGASQGTRCQRPVLPVPQQWGSGCGGISVQQEPRKELEERGKEGGRGVQVTGEPGKMLMVTPAWREAGWRGAAMRSDPASQTLSLSPARAWSRSLVWLPGDELQPHTRYCRPYTNCSGCEPVSRSSGSGSAGCCLG